MNRTMTAVEELSATEEFDFRDNRPVDTDLKEETDDDGETNFAFKRGQAAGRRQRRNYLRI